MTAWIVIGICCLGALLVLMFDKRAPFLRNIFAAATVAALLGLGVSYIITPMVFPSDTVPVIVKALDKQNEEASGQEVRIKYVEVDGKRYSPRQIFKSGWYEHNGMVVWNLYAGDFDDTIYGDIPEGSNITVVLEKNKWRGLAEITIGSGLPQTIDAFAATEQSWDIAVSQGFPNYMFDAGEYHRNQRLICAIVFAVAFLMLFIISTARKGKQITEDYVNREIWSDLLRVVCAFIIVWLHCTSGMYSNFTDDIQKWYGHLYVNCFTAVGVPCFFMISGAFLLKRKQTVDVVLHRRIPKLLIPLLVWTIFYVLLRRFALNENISIIKTLAAAILDRQFVALWFLYSLMGVYLLLPILSEWFTRVSRREKWLVLGVTYFAPSMIMTVELLTVGRIVKPSWAEIFPWAGVFLLGALIAENKALLKGKWILCLAVAAMGYCFLVGSTYAVSLKLGSPNKDFFWPQAIPTTIFTAGIMGLFVSLESVYKEKMSLCAKRIAAVLGELSFGIYLIHPFFVNMFGKLSIGTYTMATNSGSHLSMLVVAIIYFVASLSLCYVLSKLPLLRKTV
jgi:surface polysaccharide O-acyltransferase-like enzyme